MSVKSSKSYKVAYMQEEDDLGNIVDGVTYAASAAPSPTKERMNISRKKSRRGESPSAANFYTDSDSTVHPSRRESRSSRSSRHRDKSIPPAKKSVTLAARPMPRQSKTAPVIDTTNHHRRSREEASYYGIDPAMITSASSRPRSKTAAPRPNSYYGPSRPPLSNSRYHNMMQHQGMPPPPPPSAMPPPSGFAPPPQQHWQHPPPPGYAMMPPPQPMPIPGPPPALHHEPFQPPPRSASRNLHQRFSIGRPQTSMGHRPPPTVEYGHPDGYDPEELSHDMRRLSMGYRPNIEDDHGRALPMRPMSARPIQASPFAPPPPGPIPIRGRPFQPEYEEPFNGAQGSYHEPPMPYDYAPLTHVPRTRRGSIGPASVYETRPFATEVARTTGSRRNSHYGTHSASSGSGFEDKLRLATSYQDEKSGGMRLTAEMLQEASRAGGPRSRSTRSSGSRDESDWRQSATTRTTRSSNEEDLTIRIKGNALFKYGDAEMQCQDGTEINIRGPPNAGRPNVRRPGGSDKSSYAEIEDRRSRFDRPALMGRAASQTGSVFAPPPGPPYGYSYGGGPEYSTSPFAPLPANQWL